MQHIEIQRLIAESVSKTLPHAVAPAEAGVQRTSKDLDSGFRRNDET
jgi:hypothetical protein